MTIICHYIYPLLLVADKLPYQELIDYLFVVLSGESFPFHGNLKKKAFEEIYLLYLYEHMNLLKNNECQG